MFENYKNLWLDNKLVIINRKNKATFEALRLLDGEEPPYIFYTENWEEDVEITHWQSLRKLKDVEHLYCDGSKNLDGDALILEPSEILKAI